MTTSQTAVPQGVTGFQFHKMVNARLAEEGITTTSKEGVTSIKRIPPQMIYNYTLARIAASKTPFIKVTPDGLVDLEDGKAWLEKYIAKLQAK